MCSTELSPQSSLSPPSYLDAIAISTAHCLQPANHNGFAQLDAQLILKVCSVVATMVFGALWCLLMMSSVDVMTPCCLTELPRPHMHGSCSCSPTQ